MDTASYQVDTLLVSYRGNGRQVKTQTLLGQNSWFSPEFIYKTGDSVRADVQAFGILKKALPVQSAGVIFETYNTDRTPPPYKNGGGGNKTPILGNRFQHSSYSFYNY